MLNKDICLPHVFNQHDTRLKKACEKYYRFSNFDKTLKQEAKKELDVAMKLFFEAVEMLSQYNFDRTQELLRWIRDTPGYPQRLKDMIWKNGDTPNCQQLALNYMKFSANEVYREKWALLEKEIIKKLNFRKAKATFGNDASLYECCIQFIRDGGLKKFWESHKEFLRDCKNKEKKESISDEFLVMAGEACVFCEHHAENNVFQNAYLQEANTQ